MDSCPKNLEKFVDLDKCLGLIDDLNLKIRLDDQNPEKTKFESEKLVEVFKKTTDFYQEQPELLEPYLDQLIQRLSDDLININSKSIKYHVIFKFLYQLIKVVGFKAAAKKFPHEVEKLHFLVDRLELEDPKDRDNWQTRFVLTVWLSIVVLTPFDLEKFDSKSIDKCISDKIYLALIKSLEQHDSCQHATAFCLAKFLSRPDIIKSDSHLSKFISSALDEVSDIKTSGPTTSSDDVLLIGYLRTLAYMFKFLPREELKKRCPHILGVLLKLDIEKVNRELASYLIVKLIQRAGLSLLPKPMATWRYKRGARILGHMPGNLSEGSLKPANEQQAENSSNTNNDDEVVAAESIESIMGILFVAAQNSQTKIRWSAAKGIARLASRLSRERASDVIDMLLENFFNDTSSEFAWHGGCLTLAEMSRNGLILEEKLESVVSVIEKAITYDKIKGSFAVGAHVREGACYVCWAMARTYEDHLLASYVSSISVNLLCTMLFDRELQCRRAASATFQELLGRQGTFNDEGISILTNVDYQSVCNRQITYLQLALQVASYGPKYSKPFVLHLLGKLGHWDIQIRRLASEALAPLMLDVDHDFVRSEVIPSLMEMSKSLDINTKHGGILGLAKVTQGLSALQFDYEPELVHFFGTLVKGCEKQLKSKQQAANFIECIVHVIQSAEIANFHYEDNSDILKQWEQITLSSLDSDNANLRDIGSDALLTLYRFFYKSNKTCQDRVLTILNKSLASQNESTRCGALKALSKLAKSISSSSDRKSQGKSIRVDADTADIILTSLTSYISKESREKERDIVFAHAKAEACDAFSNFCCYLDKSQLILSSKFISVGYDALIGKTEDYTSDKRGDIGVVVRRAAVKALQDLTLYLLSVDLSSLLDSERVGAIMARTLQQAVSYHDSIRDLSSRAAYNLATAHGLDDSRLAHKGDLLSLFERYHVDDTFNWRDDSTQIFVHLLSTQEYSVDIWTGLIPGLGQMSDLCSRQFKLALANYIRSLESAEERDFVFDSLIGALTRPDMSERLLSPGLITLDYLLTEGLLAESSGQFQDNLINFCWQTRLANDSKRLISLANVLSLMLQFSGSVQLKALNYCLELLASGYSKVRAHTAEQLYLSLMTYQPEVEANLEASRNQLGDSREELSAQVGGQSGKSDERPSDGSDLNGAMAQLSQTNWTDPLDKVRQIRDQIRSNLGVRV